MTATTLKPQAMNATTRLSSKVILIQRDLAAAGADVAYTGVGFTPTAIIVFMTIATTKMISNGICDNTKATRASMLDYNGNADYTGTYFIFFNTAASQVGRAVVKTFDADGFTLTWDKVNSPTGTATGYAICFQ